MNSKISDMKNEKSQLPNNIKPFCFSYLDKEMIEE
jgi:hypothetical protein